MLIITISVRSQSYTYKYNYDNNGNRVTRLCLTLKSTENVVFLNKDVQYLPDDVKIEVFPNPAHSFIILTISPFNSDCADGILIYDLSGKVVYQSNNILEENYLDLDNFTNGEYILKVTTGTLNKTFKVLKK